MTASFGTSPFGTAVFGGSDPSLQDWQFELAGLRFGADCDVAVSEWEPGGSETRDQDQPAGWGDWRNFGRDRKTPGAWTFTLAIRRRAEADALSDFAPLSQAWDQEQTRLTPQAVLPLRYRLGGRTRRVYGRPRRFTPVFEELVFGRISIAADFQLADPWTYDDEPETASLSLGAAATEGVAVTFPTSFPRLWGGAAGSPGTRSIIVGGARPTWLSATITGPVTDPYLIVGGSVLQLRGTLPAGSTNAVTVSALPWAQGIYRAVDGTAAPLYLDAASRLSSLRVSPAQYLLTFGGIDPTGSATCDVSWRAANNSI